MFLHRYFFNLFVSVEQHFVTYHIVLFVQFCNDLTFMSLISHYS